MEVIEEFMRGDLVGLLLVLLIIFNAMAEQTSDRDIRLLNNRFRIDATITQVTFLIYREKHSKSVILIQPDGLKLYAWRHPYTVSWHQEYDMDIISVLNPMPGPWQAIGKVTPDNKIRILSNLSMNVDIFPDRLYQGEKVKFTARLMQDGNPLNLREFLDSVELAVTFTEFIESIEGIPVDQQPKIRILGRFIDDGSGLDEYAGDGVFTVELPVNVMPGKYRTRVTSGNGVFFRTLEQEVLVYPPPLIAMFKQSRKKELPHHFFVKSDTASIEPGTIAVHAEFTDSNGKLSVYQGQASGEYTRLTFNIDDSNEPGRHKWHAWLYATDKISERSLVFELPEQTFTVVDYASIEQAKIEREVSEGGRLHIESKKRHILEREEESKIALITIIVGNILLLVLAILTWLIIRKIQARKLFNPREDKLDKPPQE
ncbi:TIGR03503 family protein [Candidatus Enterovibrio escicola]|uniref:TIGR03503 family protein n=1 Tax=Candidatus Enterovibrio escicola TaxID=1927127 RepID=UPI001CC25E60|nr:TIGR03503 family protein [Candidatus Enterovibrio escacola]